MVPRVGQPEWLFEQSNFVQILSGRRGGKQSPVQLMFTKLHDQLICGGLGEFE